MFFPYLGCSWRRLVRVGLTDLIPLVLRGQDDYRILL
jgi:hypothetical protein